MMLDRRSFVTAGLGAFGAVALSACGSGNTDSDSGSDKKEAKGQVYYLNFKPEQDEQWQELAKVYTDETGVPVTVKTAASGQYETSLKAEMAKSQAPTLFQVNGPVGLASWKDYCYDLDGAEILKGLTNDAFELKGEENQGLCAGSENYWCVNKNASEDDINATLEFINWCVTSDTGTKAMCGSEGSMPSGADGMGFVIPFETAMDTGNKLNEIADEYAKSDKVPVDWCFSTMPSEQWKDGVGSALTTYAADQSDANWDALKTAFVDGWATEAAAAKAKSE